MTASPDRMRPQALDVRRAAADDACPPTGLNPVVSSREGGMAVSEDTIPRRRAVSVPRPGRKFLAFIVSIGLGIGLVGAGVAAYHQTLVDRILPGVSVAGVDVGGMTVVAARGVLADRLRSFSEGGLTVRTSIGSTTIAFVDVGRGADLDGMLAEAAAVGHGGSWLDETVAGVRVRLEPRAIALRILYDHDRAATAVRSFGGQIALGPINAGIVAAGAGFRVIPGVDGSSVDATMALAAVDRAMNDPATVAGAAVEAPVVSLAPRRTTASAEEAQVAVAKMTLELRLTNGPKHWTVRATRVRTWISFVATEDGFQPVIDRRAIAKHLAPIAKKVARPVLDAGFLRDKHGRIVGSRADHAGRALDVAGTIDSIAAAIEGRATGTASSAVKLTMVAIAPKRTAAQVAQTAPLMVKVGGWTTFYQVAAHNGFGANITVPARRLNGTVVQPGQLFDFWGALGEVSFRTGYRLGGAIIGGHSVEGKALAGGICAASTTLFNAALRGGFEIVSRQPHWYYITRYPLGLDATVSGSQSMQFRNDTSYPILIRGFASPGVVRFEIWSVPNGRTVTLTRPIVTNVVRGYDSTVKTASLPRGTNLRTEWPVDGKDVVVTRTVRDAHGRIVHRETYVSHYHRMVGILQIGIG
jgi:vancomycin resistance protein YoaR